ncbi:hypothetical protein RYZ26_09500 [Terasakiella sp. A23]|uniref:hypothetical protein n=1 Tax=Terasakiella sp. FCG-A23 TaxID=3080561 RepID=UPI0029554390|nr:hypothetical protein [Terasakiella sp. A23]MDV7339827.1 hypothetical protein [Terasakiella sp. A23]
MKRIGLIFIFSLMFCTSGARADYNAISALTNELTHHIVTVMREMRENGARVEVYCEDCSHKMLTRHTYQRAFDIDHELSLFLKMHGINAEDVSLLQYKMYNQDDLEAVLRLIDNKLEMVLTANEIDVVHNDSYEDRKLPRDHYAVLDRIENFLLSIGTPSIQPKTVFRRAKTIRKIIKSLCIGEVCPATQPSPIDLVTPKMPIHVYREVNRLAVLLKRYTDGNGIQIEGGVSVPAISREIVTPRIVNKVSGVLLADLIEIRHQIGGFGDLELPQETGELTPTHVWREFNHARRYLEELLY